MKILAVCDEGNSRSPTIASLLRYRGHETLSVGVRTSSEETRKMLAEWCDLAILTDPAQASFFSFDNDRFQVWPIPDNYRRPYNKDLYRLVSCLIEQKGL